jgi:superfamily II DNA or RNA helicase
MNETSFAKSLDEVLWKHQKEAIEFVLQRLRKVNPGTALVRMPTGTGKTGVIAVLSIAPPQSGWSLVLTPWQNLCSQMVQDLARRFWDSRGLSPPAKPRVERLYPKTLAHILQSVHGNECILVSTFSTLVAIFKKQKSGYAKLAQRLSLVFVDEGHYEPAVEWGQSVKHLRRPTLLLTATPYRNDLKLFRVKNEDVYNFTHADAVKRHIIRKVKFVSLKEPEPDGKGLRAWCEEFARFWKSADRKQLHKNGRGIICCSKMATVQRVTELLRELRVDALGIHEGFKGKRRNWLLRHTPDPMAVGFKVRVHQNKLTEGLDDSRFCVVAILNRIRNDRKLIQQVGRVLRTTARKPETAIVLYSRGLAVERSWNNYLEFEGQPDLIDPERYRRFLDRLLNEQPGMEYFAGRFRRKFDARSPDLPAQVLLRASCVVRRVGKDFDWNDFTDFTSDALLLEDCILLGPDNGPLTGPNNSSLWVYAIFGNTPLLMEHSQYEVRLGATAAVQHNNLLFLVDTEDLYPLDYISQFTSKVGPDELGKIFPKIGTIPKEVSLHNPWPTGSVVKSSKIHADNLADTPAQLSDAVSVCSTARANVRPDGPGPVRRHYVGFQRGRLSEQLRSTDRSEFSLREYVMWTKELGQRIEGSRRVPPDFFRRYLSQADPPVPVVPKYLVLKFYETDREVQDAADNPIEFVDSISELTEVNGTSNNAARWECTLRYRDLNNPDSNVKEAKAGLAYDPGPRRFRIHGEALNQELTVFEDGSDEGEGFVTYLNNHDELFTIALREPELFYAAQSFYRLDYTHAEARIAGMLIPWQGLDSVRSEKGKTGARKTEWDSASIFRIIDSRQNSGLIPRNFGKPEFLFCDDLNQEPADFVCANFSTRKIAFIHAKNGDDHSVSASALHVIVAQAQKNLTLMSRGGSVPATLDRWTRDSKWPNTNIRRWRLGARSLPEKDALWAKIRSEILDYPESTREVWLVLGKTLERAALVDQLQDPDKRDAVTGQVLYLLSCLQSSCIQLGVRLRVFCH